jgi:hypothetical protein
MSRILVVFFSMMICFPVISQTLLFSENFETTSLPDSVTTVGTGTSGKSSVLFSQGLRSDSMRIVNFGDTLVMTTQTFSTSGNSFVMLYFDHICKIEFFDEAFIEVSNNNGNSWTRLSGQHYQGNSQFAAQGNKFTAAAYTTEWAAGSYAVPANSWWRGEVFDISLLVGNASQVKIRFVLRDASPGSIMPDNYAWFIDNIRVIGAFSELNPPVITMVPPIIPDTVYSTGPYTVRAKIIDQSLVDTAFVIYQVNYGPPDTLGMLRLPSDTFVANIPFPGFGKNIHYRIVAIDGSAAHNVANTPTYHFFCKFSTGGTYEVGNGTLVNMNTSYPTPYGNFYWGAKHHFLIRASELQALGVPAGNIGSLAFNVAVPQGVPLQGFSIKMGNTTLANLTNTFTPNLTTVYTSTTYTETAGWNTHTFQTPFAWNDTDNLIVETCFNNSSYTYNATVYQTVTPFVSTLYMNNDMTGVCNEPQGWSVDSVRPNMKIEVLGVGSLALDAGVGEMVSPTGGVVANAPFSVSVRVKNFGTDTLTSATIRWRLNGVLQTPVPWTGSLLKDSSSAVVQLGTLSLPLGVHHLIAWTDNPNVQPDMNTANDSSKISFMACASQLAGNYTVGGVNPDFADPVSAVLALNQCGISAPVVFNIQPGTYTGQLHLLPVSGASATNTVTFRAANNDSTSVVIQYNANSSATNGVILLDGADHVTWKNLRVLPLNATFGTAIHLLNGAASNTIQGCFMTGLSGTDVAQALIRCTGPVNHDNIILGNNLVSGSTAILVQGGSVISKVSNPTIQRNVLTGFSIRGILCEFAQNPLIEGNILNATVPTGGTRNGIELLYSAGTMKVLKNKIVLSDAAESTGILLKELSGTPASEGLTANNFVSVLSGLNRSIGIHSEGSTHQGIIHNSLYVQGATSANTRGIAVSNASGNVTVLNNSVESNHYPTMYEGAAVIRSDYNNLYSSGNLYGYFTSGFNNYTSLAALKLATQKDSASISFKPYYNSNIDLHTFNGLLNGGATPVVSVPEDIDGELRDLYFPDIGADEFTPSPYDAAVLTILTAVSACGYTAAEDVTIQIKNAGSATIQGGLTACYQIVGSTIIVCEPVTATIPSPATFNYTFNTKANFAVDSLIMDSVFTIKAWVSLTGDILLANDSALAWFTSSFAPAPPQVSNATIGYGAQVSLSAQSTWDVLWYDAPAGGILVGVGNTFMTPLLYDTTTYHVASFTQASGCPSPRVPVTVFVTNIPPVDMGIVTINSPVTGFNLTAAEPVTITVANWGTLSAAGFQLGYAINGGVPVVETPTLVMAPGTIVQHTFATPANLSAYQTYVISAFVIHQGDTIPVNDTLSRVVENKPLVYCTSSAWDPGYEDIVNVTVNTMSNTSPASGSMYTDFTQSVLPTQLAPGMTYPISVSTDFPPGYSFQYPCWVKAWIDFDVDGSFEPLSEMIFSSATTSQNTVSGTFTVPSNIAPGPKTLRVVFSETSMANWVQPCGMYSWGETEDYIVMIAPLIPLDAGVTTIAQPTINMFLTEGDTVPVFVSIKNFGLDTITSLDVVYTINNGVPVITPFQNLSLAPGMVDTVMLPSFICPPGTFSMCSYTILQGDSNAFNDQTCRTFFGNPQIDLFSYRLEVPLDGCDLGTDTIRLCFRHVGGIPFTGPITLSYKVNGGSTITENLSLTMSPGDSVCYTFNTLYNFGVTTTDSLYNVSAWVRHPADGVFVNDTLNRTVKSLHTPANPVVSSVTIPYATPANLTATSPTNDTLLWYKVASGGSFIHMGSTMTTGLIFNDTTLYVEAIGAIPFQTYTLGTGTLQNSSFSYPTPYGNFYWGNKEQYILRASELTALGMVAGEISSLAFDVVTPGGIPLQGFTIKMGHTTQNDALQNFINYGMTTVYYTSAYTDVPGWNTHTFQTPFMWDGVSNLVIEVCFNNSNYVQNGVVRQTATSFPSTTQYNNDQSGVCGTTYSWSTYNQRPNFKLVAGAQSCASTRVPVHVFVQPQVPCDVGVSTILQPVTAVNLTAQENVAVRINNYGTQPQSNFQVSYRLGTGPVVTETVTVTIPANGNIIYTFNTKANLSAPGSTWAVQAWTNLGCDNIPPNDSAIKPVIHLLPVYCISTANNPFNQEITNVTFSTMNNTSAANGAMYTDFSSIVSPAVLLKGVSYTMSVNSSFAPGSSAQQPCWVKAWVDFNRDGVFDPVTEMIFSKTTTSNAFVSANVIIPATAATGTTRMRVVLQQTTNAANVNPCGSYNSGETEDYLVMIAPPSPCDAGVTAILSPAPVVQSGVPVPVKVAFRNYGQNTIPANGLSVAYRLNNGTPVIMAVPASMVSGKLDSIILPNIVIPPGNHTLCAYTILGCDTVVTFNDELCINIYGEVHAPLPYFDNFETVNHWHKPVVAQSWQYGTPTANTINSAHSGTKAWVTNLTGDYPNNANDFLYTPKFNFQGLTGFDTVVLSFNHWCAMENGDYGRIQYTTNGGATWSNLGFVNDPLGVNWYNAQSGGVHYFNHANSGWMSSSYKLQPNTFNGNNGVQFRFNMVSNGTGTANGWAIDDFRLSPPPSPNDVGVSAILYPASDTATGSVVPHVIIEVTNYGTNTQTSVPVTLKMDGMVIAAGILNATIPPQGTATYQFTPGFTVPANPYNLCAFTSLAGDVYAGNDQYCAFYAPLAAWDDVGIAQILEPIPDALNNICAYLPPTHNFTYDVKVRIMNHGQNTQTSIPIEYTFYSGGPVYAYTWTGQLPSGGFTDVILPQMIPFKLGAQQVCVRTTLATDPVTANDEACRPYVGVTWCLPGTDIPDQQSFSLFQNIPNPTGTHTVIGYDVRHYGKVTFGLVNIVGQTIKSEQYNVVAGYHEIELDVTSLSAGVYYYFIEFNGQRLTKKMVVNR